MGNDALDNVEDSLPSPASSMLTFAMLLGGCAAVKVEVVVMAGEWAEAVSRVRISAWQKLAMAAAGAEAGPARSATVMQHPLTR
jgi:hypothetical protein